MKKLLFLALMAVCSFSAMAQLIDAKKAPMGVIGWETQALPSYPTKSHAAKAPIRRAQLAENERLLGLYLTDDYAGSQEGIGLNLNATEILFSIIPNTRYRKMTDGKVKAIRFALANPCTVTKVVLMTVSEEGALSTVKEQPVEDATSPAGWTTVALDEPYALPTNMAGIAIGFEYQQTSGSYPISLVGGNTPESFMLYGDIGYGTPSIYDFSSNGILSIQAVVECNDLPQMDIILDEMEVGASCVAAGEKVDFGFGIYNYGKEEAQTFQINIKLGDKIVDIVTEESIASSIAPGNIKYFVGQLPTANDTKGGAYTLSAEVVSVNGNKPTECTEDDRCETSLAVYQPSDLVARQKYLIEEMTSHTCTYCPYGANVLEALVKKSDKLAIACIHGNQSAKDPFNTQECEDLMAYLYCQGFPSATFNRIYFGGQNGIAPSLGYSSGYDNLADQFLGIMQQYSAPSFASVNIIPELIGNELHLTVTGQGSEAAQALLHDQALTVYVIEDGLKYRQLSLGIYNNNYIHNHVLRKVATAINGDDINWTSPSTYENTFTINLDPTWVKENLSVIAFLGTRQPLGNPDRTNMAVSNADCVTLFDSQSDVLSITTDRKADDCIYTIAGQRTSDAKRPGLYIVGGQKVLVK